jgi:hypothetical protein
VGLIGASSVLGVYMGWSAVGQIDPFYYTPKVHGTRYASDRAGPVEPDSRSSYAGFTFEPAHAPPHAEADYPYAPEPQTASGIEPAAPADLMPDPARDVADNSNLGVVTVPAIEPAPRYGCTNCGGPYDEISVVASNDPNALDTALQAPPASDETQRPLVFP